MNRRQALLKAMEQCKDSLSAVNAGSKEWSVAHDAYNDCATEMQPKAGRYSGADLEFLRLQAVATYEQLLDNIRIHRDNLAHLAVLEGKAR